MHRRVLAEPEQFITETDLNRMGSWPQEGVDTLTRALLVSGRLYKDLQVVANGLQGVVIAPGILFDAGRMYAAPEVEERSIAEFQPFEAGKQVILTLVAQGQEVDGFQESRTFEREIATGGGGTVTQLVPDIGFRAKVRRAVLSFSVGAPSITPVRPPVPLSVVAIADILVGTGGIVSITRRTEQEAPELDELARAFTGQSIEIALIQQSIGGIRNDVAALFRDLARSASRSTIAAITRDVSRLKDQFDMPDTGSPYGADRFLTSDESDVGNVDYKARVEEGIRFPYENRWKGPLALYNANDPNLMHAAQGLICAKYTIVDGIRVDQRAGSMPLGGTTYQTMELTQLTMSREVTRYGDYFETCTNFTWWQSGRYDAAKNVFAIGNETYEIADQYRSASPWSMEHTVLRMRRFWTDQVRVPYDVYAPVTNVIQGVLKSQTFIQSQGRWSPGCKLAIDSWSAGAEITAALVECDDDGKPNRKRALATATLSAADFEVFPGAMTEFPWGKPVWLRQGIYAVVFATTGDVRVSYAEGQKFLGGTLFDSTDGFFQQGDLTRDLCFAISYCRFDVTRLPVLLAGLNLAGGIHNAVIKAGMIVPTNADARWAFQVGGAWRALPRPSGDLPVPVEEVPEDLFGSGITPFYDFRVELAGNQWEMPIIDMAASEVTLFRSDDDVRHISEPQLLGAVTNQVVIRAEVAAWDPLRHTLACRLLHGAGYATLKGHDAVETKPVIERADAREMIWTFNFGAPGIDRCKIDFLGATNNARITFHVEFRVRDAA